MRVMKQHVDGLEWVTCVSESRKIQMPEVVTQYAELFWAPMKEKTRKAEMMKSTKGR